MLGGVPATCSFLRGPEPLAGRHITVLEAKWLLPPLSTPAAAGRHCRELIPKGVAVTPDPPGSASWVAWSGPSRGCPLTCLPQRTPLAGPVTASWPHPYGLSTHLLLCDTGHSASLSVPHLEKGRGHFHGVRHTACARPQESPPWAH